MIGDKKIEKLLHSEKGLTLVEIIISLFIFSLIIGSVTGIFITGIKTQKRLLQEQKLSAEISYVLEYMSRAIRMARSATEEGGDCANGNYYKSIGSGEGIKFLNYEDDCQEFFLQNDSIMEKKSDKDAVPLTSGDIKIITLNFNNGRSDWAPGFDNQPKIIIFIEAEHSQDESIKITVQTTISRREFSS